MIYQRISRAKIILIVMMLIFTLPAILASILFTQKKYGWSMVNQGDLIRPPFSISEIHNLSARKWHLLVLHRGSCDEDCEKSLFYLRQIRLALGKEQDRLVRVILTSKDDQENAKLHGLLNQSFVGTQHWAIENSILNSVFEKNVHQPYALKNETKYLIDPNGNVMMSYKPDTDPNKILKDAERLLKLSRIG